MARKQTTKKSGWSEERKKAQSERMKQRHAALKQDDEFEPTAVQEKKQAQEAQLAAPQVDPNAEVTDVTPQDNQPTSNAPQPTAPIDMQTVTAIAVAVAQALSQNPQIAQAKPEEKLDSLAAEMPSGARQGSARLGAGGEVQGVVYKYDITKDYYPDPTAKLLDEPRLARFAMRENFIFRWGVDGVEYKKNNITYTEPRFTLELFRKIYNEDGEPTGKAALVARQMLHEDEFTTRTMAMRMGVIDEYDEDDEGFRALMSAMRYERFKQWLFAVFTPPKIETHRKRPTTQVIAGKVVEVYDTENLIDADAASDKQAALASQDGVGKVATPEQTNL